jgi:Flp pilus assembly pilin Flp
VYLGKWRRPMDELLRRIWPDDEAQDLVEYVLMVLLVSVALVGALGLFTGGVSTVFSQAISAM